MIDYYVFILLLIFALNMNSLREQNFSFFHKISTHFIRSLFIRILKTIKNNYDNEL